MNNHNVCLSAELEITTCQVRLRPVELEAFSLAGLCYWNVMFSEVYLNRSLDLLQNYCKMHIFAQVSPGTSEILTYCVSWSSSSSL